MIEWLTISLYYIEFIYIIYIIVNLSVYVYLFMLLAIESKLSVRRKGSEASHIASRMKAHFNGKITVQLMTETVSQKRRDSDLLPTVGNIP